MDEHQNFTGDYSPHSESPSFTDTPPWMALLSLALSIMSIMTCCCCCGKGYNALFAAAALIFGLISIANKWEGKSYAVLGVTIAATVLLIFAAVNFVFREEVRDIRLIRAKPHYFVTQYDETEQIPEEFEKYRAQEYDKYWRIFGFDSFDEFYSALMDQLELTEDFL